MQIASTIGLAKRFGHDYELPEWEHFKCFAHKFNVGNTPFFDRKVQENDFTYDHEYWEQGLSNLNETINIVGYLQSANFWQQDREWAKDLFKFDKKFTKKLDKLFSPYEKETTMALHVRRGDYVGNPNYFNLGINYYLNAISQLPRGKLILFTDDYNYCENMFKGNDVVFDFKGLSDIEHLYLMTKCDHFIASNSTFSWWGAYLGEKKHSIVIRPDKYFTGKLSGHNTADFWPEEWTPLGAMPDRDDLSDVTVVIPISFDSRDRKNNIQVVMRWLVTNFKVKIIIGEQGSAYRFKYLERYCKYVYFEGMQFFHRTKMINDLVRMADTSIVVVCDSDVLIPSKQMISAATKIRSKQADIVFPYDGRFVRCQRRPWTQIFNSDPHKVNQMNEVYHEMSLFGKESFGGIFFVDKDSYIDAGMENENFISFGREDVERVVRFKNLGLTVTREDGLLYHLQHKKGLNSSMRHPHAKQNVEECRKVIAMKPKALKKYVKSWGWV